jgi:hypothetical protein
MSRRARYAARRYVDRARSTESSISAGDLAVDDTSAYSPYQESLLRERLTRHGDRDDPPEPPELNDLSAPRNLDIPLGRSLISQIPEPICALSGAVDLEYAIPNVHRPWRPSRPEGLPA